MKILIILSAILITTPAFSKKVTLETNLEGRKDVKVYLPKGFKKKDKWPLIISMHGFGGSSTIQNYYVRLKRYKSKFGYVFAAPNGLKNEEGKGYWNASEFCCDFGKRGVDDVAYIKGIIDEIKNSKEIGRIDPSRIYLIGYSNGAFLASKIACSNEVKIAGIVTMAGTSDLRDSDGELIDVADLNCEHDRPIPTLHVHGSNDSTIAYDGIDNGKTAHVGALEQVARWAKQNRCSGNLVKQKTKINASNFIRGKETDHFVMENCDAPVEHFRVNGGAHFGVYKKKLTREILKFLFSI